MLPRRWASAGGSRPSAREPWWTRRWSATVPVHLWHGRQEWATHVSAIRAVADHRAGWDVLVVPGCSALLGFWPELFLQAHQSFLTGNRNGGSGDGQEF